MYKYLSILLGILLLVLGCFYLYEKHSHGKDLLALNNQISKLQGTVKETETAYSRQALDMENLKVKNNELQKIIQNRDETIFALSQVALKLKDKAFEDKNAKETVENGRTKVEFNQGDDLVNVSGYTLSNPAYASVKLTWKRPLKLNLALTKKDGIYKIYVDGGSDVVPSGIDLKFDSSIFEKRWYQKIQLNNQILAGEGLFTSLGVGYDFLQNLSLGPTVGFYYNGIAIQKVYGISSIWYPFY